MTVTVPPVPAVPPVLDAPAIAGALDNPPPTDEQRRIIESPPDEPLLVVAGAGSGKTETMASRVVWLVANGYVDPDQVLGLTFTRKAASELAERIGARLRRLVATGLWTPRALDDEGAEALGGIPVVSTYHSYAGRLVREHALRLGVEPEARLLSEAAAWQYAAEAVSRYDGDVGDVTSAESTVIEAVVNLAGEMAEHLLEPEQVGAYIDGFESRVEQLPRGRSAKAVQDVLGVLRNRRAILPMVHAYTRLKRDRDALDFADQMALAARLARDFPSIGGVERERFRAVLLDEYQDTSEAQLVLLRSLYAAPAGNASDGSVRVGSVPVTAVGDPNQSIYGWRGASATTLSRFPTEFGSADVPAKVLPLSTSWRNDTSILRAANVISSPLRSGPVGSLRSGLGEPLRARRDAGPGEVEVGRFETVEDEAAYLAAWVAGRWRSRSGRTRHSAAVLCRKRSQFPAVVEALRAQELPVEVVGLGGLLQTPEVSDVVALLSVVQDPTRGDRLMRLLTGPMCRLGPADLDGLATWARQRQRLHRGGEVLALPGMEADARGDDAEFENEGDSASDGAGADESGLLVHPGPGQVRDQAPESAERASIVEAIDDLPLPGWRGGEGQYLGDVARARLERLSRVVKSLRGLTGLALAEFVGEAERAVGLDIEVLARPEHTMSSARAHLDALADVAATFSSSADRPTLGGFLAWLDAAVEQERGLDTPTIESSLDAVQVLTVHAAKGLEWDHVAVPGLVEGSFPAREGGVSGTWKDGAWVVPPPADKGWCLGADGVPYDLRGDRDGLPRFPWQSVADWDALKGAYEEFVLDGGRHAVAEERRLAYVALTRARHGLLLTAPVWADPQTPRVTSTFLLELVEEPGQQIVPRHWAEMPVPADGASGKPTAANPRLAEPRTASWPADPMSARRAELGEAAARVNAAMAAGPPVSPLRLDGATEHELELLLADRAQARRPREVVVDVPRHLSASAVVQLATDSARFGMSLRRPMPAPPALAARRGTAFHAWVEQHYARAAIVDVVDLPGSADEDAHQDQDLPLMKRLFLASEWADRVPEAVEIAVETMLDGFAIRGRIDAVFPRQDGGWTIVDWKTGQPPDSRTARHRTLQLTAYALAYARLKEVPARSVDAAFYYAQTGTTVRPRIPGERVLRELLATVPD